MRPPADEVGYPRSCQRSWWWPWELPHFRGMNDIPVLLWSPWPDDLLTWPNQKPSHRCKNARSIYDHLGICGDGFDTFLTNHLWLVESFVKICKHHPQMVGASLGFPRWAETKQSDPLSLSPSSSTKGVCLNSCKPCARGGLLWEVERRKKPGTCGENDGTL